VNRALNLLRQALLHIWRTPFVSTVTVVTVAVVFLLLGMFALLGYNLALMADRLGSGLEMSVFLKDDATDEQRAAIAETLRASPLVAEVREVSRAEALERFRRSLGAQSAVLQGLGEDLLPASFEVRLTQDGRDPEALAPLASGLANQPGVEELQYGQAWLDQFASFLRLARMVAGVVAALIVFSTLVIVSNTIRLSVYARQEEILILKLMGATDRFVKAPFYLEGVLLGTLGSTLGTAGIWLLFLLVQPGVLVPAGFAGSGAAVQFLPAVGVWAMLGGGTLLGLLGTFMSLWRNLRI
jgi:cell division transport system permease protein